MDALTLLKQDHKTVGNLLDRAQKCEPEDETLHDLASQIEQALTVHAAIEEKFLYPLLRKRSEDSQDTVDVFEAYTEHDLVKHLIALLKSGRQPDEQFKAELQVLSESVKHHVKEEESTIFSLAHKLLDKEELEDIGQKMAKTKQRLMGEASPQGDAVTTSNGKNRASAATSRKTSTVTRSRR